MSTWEGSPTGRYYSSIGFRLWRHRAETRRPFFKVFRAIKGFTYVGIGPVCAWRDGRRVGIGRR